MEKPLVKTAPRGVLQEQQARFSGFQKMVQPSASEFQGLSGLLLDRDRERGGHLVDLHAA